MKQFILRQRIPLLMTVLAFLILCSAGWAITETRGTAAEIVSSLKFPEQAPRSANEITELSVLMRVPFEFLSGIERYGFLNQHQTLSTRGAFTPETRRKAEKAFLQGKIELDQHPNSLRPKSGYLYFKAKNIRKTTIALEQYGEIIFRFKPEVMRRTTYTIGDSLLTSRLGSPPLSNLDYLKREMSLTGSRRYIEFFEALIWGDLNLSDVDSVFVPADSDQYIRDRAMAMAKRNGLGFGTYAYDVPAYTGELLEAHKHQLKMVESFPDLYQLKVFFDAAKGGRSTPEVFKQIIEPGKTADYRPPPLKWLMNRLRSDIGLSEQFIIYQHLLVLDRKAAKTLNLSIKERVRQIQLEPHEESKRQFMYDAIDSAVNHLIR